MESSPPLRFFRGDQADRAFPKTDSVRFVQFSLKMDLRRLLGQMNMGGAGAAPQGDTPMVDTAETVHVSSLALLKMLKHGASLLSKLPVSCFGFSRPTIVFGRVPLFNSV